MSILIIISIVLFHLPLAFYKDTIRRYQNMERYNPDKAFIYEFENGSLPNISLSVILYFVSSLFFALYPANTLGVHWIIAILVNTFASFYVFPFIAFYLYPSNTIMTKQTIKVIGVGCVIVGFVLYGVSSI